ncbi:MAG TPA: hypothetical protein VK179_02720 [Bacteroidales bacterium]|nr:hypothetical protein [Bacteroidales bacterium]
MIKKQLVFIFSFILLSLTAFSQVEERVIPDENENRETIPFSKRLVADIDFGLSFGSITYIKLAPDIGYRFTDRFKAGLGPIYIYERQKLYDQFNNYYKWETSIYGGKIFGSFTFYKGAERGNRFGIGDLMVHAENEVVNVERWDKYNNRIWIDNILLGPGMYQPLGERFGVSILVLWDVTQNKYSPYYMNNPTFKFVLNFNF